MIYSVGYQCVTLHALRALAEHLGATVVDVRGVPSSRKAGFHKSALERVLGPRYLWRGDVLGNKGQNATTPAGLRWLRERDARGEHTILMCQEDAPGDCHRHFLIAKALLPAIDVRHIYGDELVLASALVKDEDDPDAPYAFAPFVWPAPDAAAGAP